MRYAVTFAPDGPTVWAERGLTVLEAARQAGVSLAASCGGRGTCGGCGVRVLSGTLGQPDDVEFPVLPKLPKNVRLACRAQVVGPVTVEPLVKFRAPANTATVPVSTATSLYDFEDDDDSGVPGADTGFAESPTINEPEVAPQPARLVAAVDLGTTNVSAVVIEVASAREVGRATVENRQRSWGADVLTRLSAAMAGEADSLRDAAQSSVMDAVSEAVGEPFSALASRLDSLVISANSVMAPLATGQDASGLAAAPFVSPTQLAVRSGRLSSYTASVDVVVVEPVAGFVGGDVRAGLVATSLLEGAARPTILVDMGTNAEVVLAHTSQGGTRLTVASAPAGSALEGVFSGGTVIFGSEFVHLLALARAASAISASGLIDESHAAASRDANGILRISTHSVPGVERDFAIRMPYLSQLQVRDFQLAKAAVRAAVSGVLAAAKVSVDDIDRLIVSGAFGGAISPEDLLALGMVPEVPLWRLVPGGNTSLTGAMLIALGEDASISADVALVDLASSPTFASDLMAYTSLGQ